MTVIVSSQHKFYIANGRGEEVASAEVYEKQDTLWITNVWVHPDYRKQGFAAAIFNDILRCYKNSDLYLGVHGFTDRPLSDEQLAAWYKKFGFKETSVPSIMMRRGGE